MTEESLQATKPERMWTSAIAALVTGASFSNLLGLTKIDIEPMRDFLFSVFEKMRQHVAYAHVDNSGEAGVIATLGRFLEENNTRHTLVTDNFPMGRGAPAKGAVNVLSDMNKLEHIVVQIAKKQKLLRFSQHYFRHWMVNKKISHSPVEATLRNRFGALTFPGRLGGGTGRVGMLSTIVELNLRHPELSKFLED
jgi:hypothetical protein